MPPPSRVPADADRARARRETRRDASSSATDPPPSFARSLRVGIASGACAGIACQLVLFPLNTLKTRAQAGGRLTADRLYGGVAAELLGAAPPYSRSACLLYTSPSPRDRG